ncbi:MAG TPA: hypothetical protein VKK61_08240 [Tepidisphaeraceae bacterium]|nr:hypothetical protein [Tepidisphaeraceae bacterium]
MRAMFGLVGLLVAIGVIVWFEGSGGGLSHTQAVLKADQNAREQVNQIAGNDPDTGQRATESADLQPLTTNGKLSGFLVTKVRADGAYARYFGLQRNDTIIAAVYQAIRMDMKDMSGDQEMAKAQISEAYQRQGQLVIVRNEKQLTLPQADASSGKSGSPLQNQLDVVQDLAK